MMRRWLDELQVRWVIYSLIKKARHPELARWALLAYCEGKIDQDECMRRIKRAHGRDS